MIYPGQMMRISINGDVHLIGIVTEDYKNKKTNTLVETDYTVQSLKWMYQKIKLFTDFAEGTSMSSILIGIVVTWWGLEIGNVESSDTLDRTLEASKLNTSDVLDALADIEGVMWWTDSDWKLNFASAESTVSVCPYTISELSTAFTDFRDLEIHEDMKDYTGWGEINGAIIDGRTLRGYGGSREDFADTISIYGYGNDAIEVVTNNNIFYEPQKSTIDSGSSTYYVIDTYSDPSDQPDIQEGDFFYNATRDKIGFISTISINSTTTTEFYLESYITGQQVDDEIWYNRNFNDAVDKYFKSKQVYRPQYGSFNSYTLGFKARQKMFVSDRLYNTHDYFCITKVYIEDMGAGIFKSSMDIEKRSGSDDVFNVMTFRDYINFWKKF